MKNNLLKILTFLSAAIFFFDAFAAPQLKMDLQPDGLYIDNVNVAVLKKIFKDYKYEDFVRENNKIPPIFLESMPFDFNDIKSQDERNKLFIMIMAPLVLKINEEIVFERQKLREIKKHFDSGEDLTEEERKTLNEMAAKYDVFTRMKEKDYDEIVLRQLLLKVNVVPPAIVIAAAAAESNWGTASEVVEGNALYKIKNWYTDEGIKPKDEDDDSYRIRTYPDLLSAVRDYALKLNSDINFHTLRVARKQLHSRNKTARGRMTVYNMVVGSPLENYAGLLSYILTFYDLINVDESTLNTIVEMENE